MHVATRRLATVFVRLAVVVADADNAFEMTFGPSDAVVTQDASTETVLALIVAIVDVVVETADTVRAIARRTDAEDVQAVASVRATCFVCDAVVTQEAASERTMPRVSVTLDVQAAST